MKASTVTVWVCLICLTLVACRRKKSESAANAVPASESAAALGIQAATLPDNKTLYTAINKHMAANQGRAAKSLDELVNLGFLKPLPPLPPGKRYELDQRSVWLTIVDK